LFQQKRILTRIVANAHECGYRTGEDHFKGIIDYGFSQSDLDAIGRGNAQRLMPQWKS
jgi:hypothetical protein